MVFMYLLLEFVIPSLFMKSMFALLCKYQHWLFRLHAVISPHQVNIDTIDWYRILCIVIQP